MSIPTSADFVVIGAGIHGLSTAWHLGERLSKSGKEASIVVLDKNSIGAGASGIACGVIRNNYFQPAMRELMAHSVGVWESDPKGFSYHPVGYLQISCEKMRTDVASIFEQQMAIGYESEFIEGTDKADTYMRGLFSDWRAQGITSVLHEKRGGFANNMASLRGLAKKAESVGAQIFSGVTVIGMKSSNGSAAIESVVTDQGIIQCGQVVVATGPWVRDFWDMLNLPKKINIHVSETEVHKDVDMWRYWQLEEGVLDVDPGFLTTNDGKLPPVIHVDTDATLYSSVDGSIVTEDMWGIYYKPDTNFGGIQGGAMPYKVKTPVAEVQIDPYGPDSAEFIASDYFAYMWCSALAHCHKRFDGMTSKYRKKPSGGIGCFTPDNFPVFDRFCENAYVVADSNHGYKMIGIGALVAEELLGAESTLLKPFRFDRFKSGELHPVSSSPFPWS